MVEEEVERAHWPMARLGIASPGPKVFMRDHFRAEARSLLLNTKQFLNLCLYRLCCAPFFSSLRTQTQHLVYGKYGNKPSLRYGQLEAKASSTALKATSSSFFDKDSFGLFQRVGHFIVQPSISAHSVTNTTNRSAGNDVSGGV